MIVNVIYKCYNNMYIAQGYIVYIGTRGKEKGTAVKLQNGIFPEHILIEVPKGKECTVEGQTFSTDDLPDKLKATYEGLEPVRTIFREVNLIKYSVEPIFSLQINGRQDVYRAECYDIECVNRLCSIISQPWIHDIRSSMPEDKFVVRNTGENPYWLYTPDDKYDLSFSKDGKIWKTSVVFSGGYYYEIFQSIGEAPRINKVVNSNNLSIRKPKAVKPVIFLEAKAFEKMPEKSIEIA